MGNEVLYALIGAAGGAAATYFLIKAAIIPSPVTARIPARASFARPQIASKNSLIQQYGKFSQQRNGRTFGGIVTAENIPSQYARSGILARPSSQIPSDPAHFDLVRVD